MPAPWWKPPPLRFSAPSALKNNPSRHNEAGSTPPRLPPRPFSDPRGFCPRAALRPCFMPLTLMGFALQGFPLSTGPTELVTRQLPSRRLPCSKPRGLSVVDGPESALRGFSTAKSPCPRMGVLHPIRGRFPPGLVVACDGSPVSPPFQRRVGPDQTVPASKGCPLERGRLSHAPLYLAEEPAPLRRFTQSRRLASRGHPEDFRDSPPLMRLPAMPRDISGPLQRPSGVLAPPALQAA
jgi:hypothetical protein